MSDENDRSNPRFTFVKKGLRPSKFDLPEQVTKFLYTKRIEKRSPKTIEIYEQTLNQFRRWYDEKKVTAISPDIMREYVHYLTFVKSRWDDHPTSPNGATGLSARSVNNIIRNLKVFFNYLTKERIITRSPVDAIGYQSQDKDTFEIFTDDDVIKLINAPNKRVFTGLRDVCMMLVLSDCGCRIGELTNLKISDVDFKLRQVTFRAEITKPKTTRVIPLSKRTVKELETLIAFMNVKADDYLWLTQFGERYMADTFAKMLKKYAKKAGVTEARVSPHTFRHYAAVSMLRNGMNPIAVSRMLGHASTRMTEVYVKYTADDLGDMHDIASPVANLMDGGNDKKRGKRRFT